MKKLRRVAYFRFLARRMTPARSLAIGFVMITLAGAFLLCLPISSANGTWQFFVDSLFTASSAITTTGLVVVDTGSYYSLFGQIVIMILFQIGGLGYMVFIVMAARIIGRLSVSNRISFQESMAGVQMGDVWRFALRVLIYTVIFELLGAFLYALRWARDFPVGWAIYLGVFHSVSAFCTAGFGLFSDSMSSWPTDPIVNITTALITVAGGIGFFVLNDTEFFLRNAFKEPRFRKTSLHTKMAWTVSLALMLLGTVAVFLVERGTGGTCAGSIGRQIWTSSFQAISASSTTGFNTVNIGAMTQAGLLILIILMFIGASPGGTGGGIKTTSFGVILVSLWRVFKRREDVHAFGKRVPSKVITSAFTITISSLAVLTLACLILTITEKAPFMNILFEVSSALGTVGLSTGITPGLSVIGKLVISATMLIGRIGPLAIGFSLMGKTEPEPYRFTEGEIYVG
jgi:trk system potassium uptake protein TrkH